MVAEGAAVRRGSRFGRILLIALGLVVLVGVLWTWFSLSFAYSEGERAGADPWGDPDRDTGQPVLNRDGWSGPLRRRPGGQFGDG